MARRTLADRERWRERHVTGPNRRQAVAESAPAREPVPSHEDRIAEAWDALTATQRAWVLDLRQAPAHEARYGNRASASALNPLLGPSSGCEGPDLVAVDYGSPRSREWSLTAFGRAVAEYGATDG